MAAELLRREFGKSGADGESRCLGGGTDLLAPLRLLEDAPEIERLFHQQYQGSRYSFGYPACPNLEDRAKIMTLLHPETIGVQITDNFMLVPEQTTDALVVYHPQAKYFDV